MRKILVVSDVHGNKDVLEDILKVNKDVDYKIYLGDFQMYEQDQKSCSKLFDYVVTGNCDYPHISSNTEIITIEGVNILITHGHHFGSLTAKIDFDQLFETAKAKECKVILHGHDHIAVNVEKDGIKRFNPGSTTFPRGNASPTYGIITIDDNVWSFKHIEC